MHEPPSLPLSAALPKVDTTLTMPENLERRTWRIFFVCLIIFTVTMADLTTLDFRSKVKQASHTAVEKLPNTDVVQEWTAPLLKLIDTAKDWALNTAWYFVFDKDEEKNASK